MSGVWVKISTILCLCYTAEMKGVEWREVGESITIQCKVGSDQDFLSLKMGLNETEIFVINKGSTKGTTHKGMNDRVQTHGTFPNYDILIKNLRESDTGPYWCIYSKTLAYTTITTKDAGSVLLVVTEKKQGVAPPSTNPQRNCEGANMNIMVMGGVIAVGFLVIMILGFVLFIKHKSNSSNSAVTPRRVATGNDVYEDMRGTLRR